MRGEACTSGNAWRSATKVASKICLRKIQGYFGICGNQRDANGFGGGLIALRGDTADGDQNIRLRIVCSCAPAGDGIWDDGKAGGLAYLTFEMTVNVHDLTGFEISRFHIKRV